MSRLASRGERLAYAVALAQQGMDQYDIAREIGVTRHTVTGYLDAHTRAMARDRWSRESVIKRIRAWADKYGTPPTWDDWYVDWEERRERGAVALDPIVSTIDGEEWPTAATCEALWEHESWGSYGDDDYGFFTPVDCAVIAAGFEREPRRVEPKEPSRSDVKEAIGQIASALEQIASALRRLT